MYPKLLLVVLIPALLSRLDAADLAPSPLRIVSVQPDEVMNAKFANKKGWVGADGIYTVPLADDSFLWMFADTLIGEIRDGKRHSLAMVNNTFAKQRGWGETAKIQFFVNRDSEGKPTSFVVPQRKPGYFWLWDAVIEQGKLYIFALRLTSQGKDWKLLDQSLIVVANPLDEPSKWEIQQLDFPFGAFTDT